MADFVISDVKKVREVFDWVRVNEHLARGWVLLSISTGQDDVKSPAVRYILGWTKGEPAD
ncbi:MULTISPECIES: hypothetical protein [Pseudomonas]|uniref:Uncharacterized protein n=1 Tax=Pseudomonas aeruginosa TaxID=287 RepID=A0A218MAN1_PSEAI|nr:MULTISPECIES: hypothetical protein [Pseudomonas]ASD54048.1 Hypothetical protein [Pseudomonas aeruginosa]AZZ88892.1 hypothetical protein ALFBHDGB_00034 [Pseudomonas aeruginosa]MBJ7563166.1 hypothetical protein [Pseudomonas sp. P20]MBJ7569480.1 hypothetical protein [Pseudomonas sp. P22]MBM0728164.1 hypothetical protein [Pseudomonas aeruginosa]